MNAYMYLNGNSAASYSSPLMDCTSAIHNLDNIQNGVPHIPTTKSPAAIAFMRGLKETPIISVEPKSPITTRRRTNDPYRRTSLDGSPCLPASPFSTEMTFMMSYKEESRRSLTTPPPASAEPQTKVTVAQSSCHAVQRRASKAIFPPAPRSGTMKKSTSQVLPHGSGVVSVGTPTPAIPRENHPISCEPKLSQSHTPTKGTEQWNTRSSASSQLIAPDASASSATPLSSTSVTRVRCKRVYVNGRPVTVWLNDDEQSP